jgi:hypothetical protein
VKSNHLLNLPRLFDSHEQHGTVHPVGLDEEEKEASGWDKRYTNNGMVAVLRRKDAMGAGNFHRFQHMSTEFWDQLPGCTKSPTTLDQ